MRKQIVIPILLEAAQELGLRILVEPTRGIYAVILFDSGKKYFIKDINFNLNLATSTSLARNKAATSYFLHAFGYHVPQFTMIYRDDHLKASRAGDSLAQGLAFAQRINFPVILKPNDMSQGAYVFKANNVDEYMQFALDLFRHCNNAQVQQFYVGNDYRIVVLDKKVLSAYQRIPLHIIGDGLSSVADLIEQKQQAFTLAGRDTILDRGDPRIAHKLAQHQLSLHSVPTCGQTIALQDISNLSVGGETRELTDKIHPSYTKLALDIARDMNLTLCGLDLITSDITKENANDYIVIEINSSPGLDNYAYQGAEQEAYVRQLYQTVLEYIVRMAA